MSTTKRPASAANADGAAHNLHHQEGTPPMVQTDSPARPDDRLKVALIRSIASWADDRPPAHVLAEVRAILDGHTIEELVTLREGLDD